VTNGIFLFYVIFFAAANAANSVPENGVNDGCAVNEIRSLR
jgi:hypothetical protein